MFKLPDNGNFTYVLDYQLEQSGDCATYGCNEEGICRCSRIENVEIENTLGNAISFFHACYEGPDDDLQRALAFWFLKRHWRSFEWDWEASGGYYGDELDSIKLNSAGDFFKHLILFEQMTTNEKIEYLLTLEYSYVLPKIREVKAWQCMPVLCMTVHNSANKKLNTSTLDEYKSFCQQNIADDRRRNKFQDHVRFLAPLCLPAGAGHFDVVDGRHRCEALQSTYEYAEVVKRRFTKVEFQPIYMWIICPKEEAK